MIHGGQALVSRRPQTEFEIDFMRPHDLDDGIFTQIAVGTTAGTFLAAAPKWREPFDTAERVRLVRALIPHLAQSLATQQRVAVLTETADGIFTALDSVQHGSIVVDSGGNVAYANDAAAGMLTSSDGLTIRFGRIEATNASVNNRIQAAINGAICPRSDARRGCSMTCERPSGKRPYQIDVIPMASSSGDPATAMVLVNITNPEVDRESPEDLVQRLFGLTTTETKVALRVARGEDINLIAENLAVSKATVRTHLQHVFDKTDTHRQADLVRLLLTVMPPPA
ncbi:hypothetical protein EB75_01745 [Mycobacterium sp. ST-F2]|nr:hypothetical protein EB75_01745 [Mycobacterium sp. ST-F2]